MSEDKLKPKTAKEIHEEAEAEARERDRTPSPTPADLPKRFHVSQTNLRDVVYDCPWVGHLLSDIITSQRPGLPFIGWVCTKCGTMVYTAISVSKVVGMDGRPLKN